MRTLVIAVPSPVIVENVPDAGVVIPIGVPSIFPPLISIFEKVEPDDVMSPVTFPVRLPVTLPVKLPSNVAATNVSAPTPHLLLVSFQSILTLLSSPRSISIPASCVALPVALLFKIKI